MKKSILLITVFLLIWSISGTYSQEINRIDLDKATSFALKEQWSELNQFLDSIPENDPNAAVLKMLKGHACLAINENDVSFCCFLTVMKDSVGLQKWNTYAADLAGINDKSSVSFYFLGDAQARLRKFDEAIKNFSLSINLNQNEYLSLNARGVTLLLMENIYDSQSDFMKIFVINKNFADVYNNMGNRSLQIMDAATGGVNNFNKSLEINPSFSIPHLGLGCLDFVLHIKDSTSFSKATKLSMCFNPFIVINFDSIISCTYGGENVVLLSDYMQNPGMPMNAKFVNTPTSNNPDPRDVIKQAASLNWQADDHKNVSTQDYGNFAKSYGQLDQNGKNQVQQFLKQTKTPDRQEAYNKAISQTANDYKPNGIQESNLQQLKDMGRYVAPTAGIAADLITQGVVRGVAGSVTGGTGAVAIKPAADLMGKAANVATAGYVANTFDHAARNYQNNIKSTFDGNTQFDKDYVRPTPKMGGVSQSFQSSFIENGKWPFIPCYGLLYNFYLLKK